MIMIAVARVKKEIPLFDSALKALNQSCPKPSHRCQCIALASLLQQAKTKASSQATGKAISYTKESQVCRDQNSPIQHDLYTHSFGCVTAHNSEPERKTRIIPVNIEQWKIANIT